MAEGPGAWLPAVATAVSERGLALAPDEEPAVAQTAVPVIVTHEGLRLDLVAADPWPVRVALALTGGDGDAWPEPVVVGGGRSSLAVDTTDLCGASVDLTVTASGISDVATGSLPIRVDRVLLAGAICPQFRDVDADGRCAQGFDRDGDGLCISDGEPLERPARADCDDTSPGPRCLSLAIEGDGRRQVLTATGAEPGEEVWFFGSTRRGTSCPPALGGVCMDLAEPRSAGHAPADPSGVARLELPASDGTWYQAGAMRVGPDSDLSRPAQAGTAEPQPVPIADR